MSRNLRILLILAALMAAYLFVIKPIPAKREAIRERLAIQYKLLMKYESFAGATGKEATELKAVKDGLDAMEKHLIAEPDASLAFARLQILIQAMAESSGLQINSIRPLETSQNTGYETMPIFLDGFCDMEQMAEFLRKLDTSPELIAMEKISIASAPQGRLRFKIQMTGLRKI